METCNRKYIKTIFFFNRRRNGGKGPDPFMVTRNVTKTSQTYNSQEKNLNRKSNYSILKFLSCIFKLFFSFKLIQLVYF